MAETNKYNQFMVPASIVLAGAIIAASIVFVFRDGAVNRIDPQPAATAKASLDIPLVSSDDHIYGNPDAKVVMIEYSDLECPFSKRFQETIKSVFSNDNIKNNVALVYRHFPLVQIHQKAVPEAIATECVAELGGNDAFWKYVNRIYEVTPTNDGLDPNLLISFAIDLGIKKDAFETCQEKADTSVVQKQFQEAINGGGQGSPWSVIMTRDGKNKVAIDGAQPQALVEAALLNALKK